MTADYTVRSLAERWACRQEHVLTLIRQGELRAVDIRRRGARRPMWRLPAQAVDDFERSRAAGASPPPKPRRRRPPSNVKEFF